MSPRIITEITVHVLLRREIAHLQVSYTQKIFFFASLLNCIYTDYDMLDET